jgi:hypothetical protein
MSAHRTPEAARRIVQVLRTSAMARMGSLTVSEVEVLEGVLRANAALLAAATEVLSCREDGTFGVDGNQGFDLLVRAVVRAGVQQ